MVVYFTPLPESYATPQKGYYRAFRRFPKVDPSPTQYLPRARNDVCPQPLSRSSAPLGVVTPEYGSQIRCAVAPRVVWQSQTLKTRGAALQYPNRRSSIACQTRDLADNPSSPKSQDGLKSLNTVEHACDLRSQ